MRHTSLLVVVLTGATACRPQALAPQLAPAAETQVAEEAPGEPLQPLPREVSLDPVRVKLGRRLFADKHLSQDGSVSCQSCHPLERGGADGLPRSRAAGGRMTATNTPTLLNVGFSFRFNWNGAFESLEAELDAPFANAMGTTAAKVVATLKSLPDYPGAFARAYPGGLTEATLRDALATYQRSLITPDGRFDRWLRGETSALTAEEVAGYQSFKDLGCASCHQGRNVGGNMFQRLGVMADYFAGRSGSGAADLGRFNLTGEARDRHVFRVPSLRNVALTAPYFHDGSAATLEEAIEVMACVQLGRTLDTGEIARLAGFLGTLDGTLPEAEAAAP